MMNIWLSYFHLAQKKMKSTCLKCGVVNDLPEGHRLIVCSACGAIQEKIFPTSDGTAQTPAASSAALTPVVEKFSLPLMTMEMRVTEHLIECAQVAYQIRNLTATAVGEREVPIKVAEPKMKLPVPSAGFGPAIVIGLVAGAFLGTLLANGVIGGIVGVAAFALFNASVNKRYKTNFKQWKRASETVEKQHGRWQRLADSSITLYSLVLETNAGTNPIFHSTEKAEMVRANDAIKDAMSNSIADGRSLSIKIVDVPFRDGAQSFDSAVERFAAAVGHQYVYGESTQA